MKNLILVLAITTLFFTQAIANFANLHISSRQQGPIKVILDGQIVAQNSTAINIEGIPAGHHYLQIQQGIYGFNSYNEIMVFQGELFLPANTAIAAQLVNNQLVIQHIEPLPVAAPQPVTYHQNQHKPVFFNPVVEPPVCQTPPVVVPEPVYYGPQAMSDADFLLLSQTIDSKWFSSGKMNVAEQAINSNFFTSNQIAALVNLFTFDGDKLKVAQMAYTKTVDPQNYFTVYNSLDYNSTINQLSAYIASL